METIIRKYLKHGADMLKPFENVPNNSVYSFESNGEGYIREIEAREKERTGIKTGGGEIQLKKILTNKSYNYSFHLPCLFLIIYS